MRNLQIPKLNLPTNQARSGPSTLPAGNKSGLTVLGEGGQSAFSTRPPKKEPKRRTERLGSSWDLRQTIGGGRTGGAKGEVPLQKVLELSKLSNDIEEERDDIDLGNWTGESRGEGKRNNDKTFDEKSPTARYHRMAESMFTSDTTDIVKREIVRRKQRLDEIKKEKRLFEQTLTPRTAQPVLAAESDNFFLSGKGSASARGSHSPICDVNDSEYNPLTGGTLLVPFPKTVATKPLRNSGSDSLEELEALNIREFSDDSDSDSEDLDLSDPEGLTKTIEAFKSAQRRASLAQGSARADKMFGPRARHQFFSIHKSLPSEKIGKGYRLSSARRDYLRTCDSLALSPRPFIISPRTEPSQCLKIVNQGIGERHAKALAQSLLHTKYITSVDLSKNRVRASGVTALAKALSRPGIISLDLSENELGRQSGEALAEILKNNTSLTNVFLDSNGLGDHSGRIIVEAVICSKSIKKLVLSHNRLGGVPVGEAVGELLRKNHSLRELDLSWNEFRNRGAYPIAVAIEDNYGLEELNLRWNGFGEGDVAVYLAKGLCQNMTLKKLDISYNRINDRCCLVFSDMLKENNMLFSLQLCGNPIGEGGGRALMRALRKAGDVRDINLTNCNVTIKESKLFDPDDPNGHYILDLSVPYDRAVAHELMELAYLEEGENWFDEKLNGEPFDLPENDGPEAERYRLPNKGILELDYRSTPRNPNDRHIADWKAFKQVKTMLMDPEAGDEVAKLHLLKAITKDLFFYADQVKELLSIFQSPSNRVEGAILLYRRMMDRNAFFEQIYGKMSAGEQAMLELGLGLLFFFDPLNASGHYRLRLDDETARDIALKIQRIGNDEVFERRARGLADLSQKGNNELWRNEELNADPFVYRGTMRIPDGGLLEFDFVSTRRPPPGALPLRSSEFKSIRNELAEGIEKKDIPRAFLNVRQKLALEDLYLSVAQLSSLLSLLPQEGLARVEVIAGLFGRLIDLEYFFRKILLSMGTDHRQVVVDRLGWLNVWNPLDPDGYYELDLAKRDERIIAEGLVALAVAEPGENWIDETFNGFGFELPVSWVREVPSKGKLTVTYHTDPNGAVPSLRYRLLKKTLLGSSSATIKELRSDAARSNNRSPKSRENHRDAARNQRRGSLMLDFRSDVTSFASLRESPVEKHIADVPARETAVDDMSSTSLDNCTSIIGASPPRSTGQLLIESGENEHEIAEGGSIEPNRQALYIANVTAPSKHVSKMPNISANPSAEERSQLSSNAIESGDDDDHEISLDESKEDSSEEGNIACLYTGFEQFSIPWFAKFMAGLLGEGVVDGGRPKQGCVWPDTYEQTIVDFELSLMREDKDGDN